MSDDYQRIELITGTAPYIERGVSVNTRENGCHAECPCQAAIRAGCDAGQAGEGWRVFIQ